ncbi:MAG: acylase, partial [Alphaproteobacteria bacterium]|nr:acylase [Alphaproteobacteria bacterium]
MEGLDMNRFVAAVVAAALSAAPIAASAQNYNRYSDAAAQSELSRIADVEMAVMVPMRDGVGLATNIYRPKGAKGPLPT